MYSEIKTRVLTSIILFIFIYICVFINLKISLLAIIIISLFSWFEFIKLSNKIYRSKNEIIGNLILILSALYFTIFGGTVYYLIAIDKIYFVYILIVCAFSDIGGYVFGRTFKGKKLTKISPNKTISGSYGSFIFSLLPYFFLKIIFIYTQYELLIFADPVIINIVMCLFLSLTCQLGDLTISYFKRLADVKDTGKILPGHGGILDRIDGIILAIPCLVFIGYLLNFFGY